MKYVATFSGRKVGALGVWSRFTVEVEADNKEAAALKLYDTHEHISDFKLVEKGGDK
jgi:hypothetical protein